MGRNTNENSVDRRQFVKKAAIAGAAAAGAIVGPRKSCAISYDENGRLVEWWCIIDVVEEHLQFWVYEWENCRTGERLIEADEPGLDDGDCDSPTTPSCVQNLVIDRWEKITVQGIKIVVSPNLSENARLDLMNNKESIANRIRAANR